MTEVAEGDRPPPEGGVRVKPTEDGVGSTSEVLLECGDLKPQCTEEGEEVSLAEYTAGLPAVVRVAALYNDGILHVRGLCWNIFGSRWMIGTACEGVIIVMCKSQ